MILPSPPRKGVGGEVLLPSPRRRGGGREVLLPFPRRRGVGGEVLLPSPRRRGGGREVLLPFPRRRGVGGEVAFSPLLAGEAAGVKFFSPLLLGEGSGVRLLYHLENLRKAYAARTVLNVNALDVREGEILALVGPSGAGKSTLLRLLNFLEAPTSGTLTYRGQVIAAPAPLALRREVTTVFQRPLLLRGSVAENIAYGLRLRGARVNSNIEQILSRIGLENMAHVPARKLSGGEMQRVALARALVIEPRVLLLDE